METNVTYQVISANGLGQTTAIDSGGEIALSKGQGLVIQVKNPIKDCRIGFCVFPRDALLIQEAENGKFGLVVEDEFEEDCLGIVVIFDASMKIVEGAVIFRIKPTQKSSEAESSI